MPVKPLTFIGDRDAPDSLSAVHARRPILGSGKQPKELYQLKTLRTFFAESVSDAKPAVHIERVKNGPKQLWQIDIPFEQQLQGARPGITLKREKAEVILKGVDANVPATGFRPDWVDQLFVPRRTGRVQVQTMRRFNGHLLKPLWVFGNDDRWIFEDPSYPWGVVGRIQNNRGAIGTGALVGDRLVITAGHVVPWGDNPWWMQFVPAYFNGVSLHGAGFQSNVSDAYGYDANVAGYDWAILRLYEPLGSWLGYFGYNGYSESWDDTPYWSIIGYPGALGNTQVPSFQDAITVGDVDLDSNGGEELESNTADVTPGDSGGPMFGWWGNDPRIVGVVSGEEDVSIFGLIFDQDNVMAGGSGFTSLIAWGRTNWPA